MNIGIIGGGAIASFLLKEINHNQVPGLYVQSIYIRDEEKYSALTKNYGVGLYSDLSQFLASDIDIIVEAANIQAVRKLIPAVLKKKDVILISIGALSEELLYQNIYAVAEKYKRIVYLPSGAIGGLDLLQSAHALGGVHEVSLTTRKPARSLLDEEEVDKEVVIFDGTANEAIKKFPKNINVSIILSLAGIGIQKTRVKIIADPVIENNSHMINISGTFGTASFSINNAPMATNPKTSYAAALSVLSTLQRCTSNIKLG
ncbi:aspartate dehydrogenase [Virgibacillus halotolerans]|uniref:aspartate dehydrogenase n=1 Tax=Virgibacillus halotolerans TaxID=1071053 RepID=UPI001961D8F5|nr:aspartate dehydrogenase [Virgibacillus halotolerans]